MEADFLTVADELCEDELNTVSSGASVCVCVAGAGSAKETLGGEVSAGSKEDSNCMCGCMVIGYGDNFVN